MHRIHKLQQSLSVDCLFIDKPIDLFYLTGVTLSLGRLALFPDRAILFVDGRYIEQARRQAPCEVKMSQDLASVLQGVRTVGFDSAFLSYDAYKALSQTYPGKEWVPISKPLKNDRAVKEANEIEALRRAARLTVAGYRHIVSLLTEGVTEEELALAFEIFCRCHGASKLSFSPIIAFGENSAYPHHRAGPTRLQKDAVVLCDLGAVVDSYAGDMTRVVFFGRPDPQLKQDECLVRQVQAHVLSLIRPGVRLGDLDTAARDLLRSHGVASLFTHGLSHGVGLETHEFPTLRVQGGDTEVRLRPGMVITVEPGLYRPGKGGVRYEDTVLVTEDSVENFSQGDHAG